MSQEKRGASATGIIEPRARNFSLDVGCAGLTVAEVRVLCNETWSLLSWRVNERKTTGFRPYCTKSEVRWRGSRSIVLNASTRITWR